MTGFNSMKLSAAPMFSAAFMLLATGCEDFGGGASVVPEVVVVPAELSGDDVASTGGGAGDASKGGNVAAGGVGTFKGKVVLTGTPPLLPLPLIHGKGASVKDAASCSLEDVPDETLVVAKDGSNGVANVFVYLARAPKGVELPPIPETEIDYDQRSCRFIPHCISVRTGQQINVINDDGVPHNAHSYPAKQGGINGVINPKDRTGIQLVYERAETIPLKVACDFHTWMIGYHLPLDHPFHAVTDENGNFEIPNLPAGKYNFVVWHENAGYVHRKFPVTVTGGEPKPQDIDFSADKLSL